MEMVIDIPEDVYKRTVFYREFKDLNDCVTTIKALEKGKPLPEHGEDVLITTCYGDVVIDTFYNDEGSYFETYCDDDDVVAWMRLPKPYERGEELDES